jgi:hypothetical protein
VIGNAVHVMRIATGEISEVPEKGPKARAGRLGGMKGGKARARALSKAELSKQGKKAAASRWRKD